MWRTFVITGPHELVFCRLKLMEAPTPQGHGEGGGLVHLALPCVWCLVLPPKACLEKAPPARPDAETSSPDTLAA
jgi:hypothetical protein